MPTFESCYIFRREKSWFFSGQYTAFWHQLWNSYSRVIDYMYLLGRCVLFVWTLCHFICLQGLKDIADTLGGMDGAASDGIVQDGVDRLEEQPRPLLRFEFIVSSECIFWTRTRAFECVIVCFSVLGDWYLLLFILEPHFLVSCLYEWVLGILIAV